MKKSILPVLAGAGLTLGFALGAGGAYAHPGHDDSVTDRAGHGFCDAVGDEAVDEVALADSGWATQTLADSDCAAADSDDGLLVDFDDTLSDDAIEAIERETGLDLIDTTQVVDGNLWLFRGSDADLKRAQHILMARSDVQSAEPNVRYALFEQDLERAAPVEADPTKPNPTKPNDPMYKSQWHFDMVHAEGAWALSQGAGVVVAVVDTGVSQGTLATGKDSKFKRVPDLKESELVAGYNFVNNSIDASDGNGHGTHVAGTIAQSTNNGVGVAGLAYRAKIMPIKVLSDGGSGTVADIANGIRFAADKGAKVINMSLGGGMYSGALASAVKYAHDKGVTVVCAAGNGARQKVEYPAAYPGCVAVSALGPDGKLAFYSSYGKELDIAAPGGDTRVDLNNDGVPDGVLQDTIARGDATKHGYFPFQGTSMATPHVAAAAALVIALGVTDPDRVEKILKDSSAPMNDAIRFGAGGLDVAAATKMANRSQNLWALGIAGLVGGLALRSAKKRDGMFSVARVTPGMVVSAIVAASGLFVLRGTELLPLSMLAAPVAEWPAVAFGQGANGWFVVDSALLAIVPALLLFGVKRARMPLAGFAFGVAGFLLARAGLGSVDVLGVPGHGLLDAVWLVANGVVAAGVGRLALSR